MMPEVELSAGTIEYEDTEGGGAVVVLQHGRRLAALLPAARLLEIPDSYTLIPEDQPDLLARAIRQFVRGQGQ
jgi:pimeloyl-ACP methyl ester carboxylesterase